MSHRLSASNASVALMKSMLRALIVPCPSQHVLHCRLRSTLVRFIHRRVRLSYRRLIFQNLDISQNVFVFSIFDPLRNVKFQNIKWQSLSL